MDFEVGRWFAFHITAYAILAISSETWVALTENFVSFRVTISA